MIASTYFRYLFVLLVLVCSEYLVECRPKAAALASNEFGIKSQSGKCGRVGEKKCVGDQIQFCTHAGIKFHPVAPGTKCVQKGDSVELAIA